jgi:hypothetical protein
MLSAAAVLVKAGFAYLKQLICGFFRKHLVPESVGPVRYGIGLLFFFLPVIGLVLLVVEFWEKLKSLFLCRAVVRCPDNETICLTIAYERGR